MQARAERERNSAKPQAQGVAVKEKFNLFLQTAAEQPSIFSLALPLLIVFGIYYAIVILPTRKTQKKVQDMIDSLKVGDKVITNSGIYGTIAGLREDRIQLRVSENVKLEMARTSVSAFQNPDPEQTK
jgi:preprotein translocase subunit YajC